MYIIINIKTQKICSEWNYVSERTKHICWKTPTEIEAANSYRLDNTHIKKFLTRRNAQLFIVKQNFNQECICLSTNRFQQKIDDLLLKYIYKE